MRTLLMSILILFAAGAAAARQVNQAALADALLKGGDVDVIVGQAEALGPQNVGPELRTALITRLEQLNQQVEDAIKRDQTVDTFIAPEALAHLAQLVAELRDPRAIPALSRATYAGRAGIKALAEFGEAALPSVLKATLAPSSHYTEVEHGLLAMRVMVELKTVSPAGLAQIRAAAKARLTGDQYFTVVWQAIDLAGALRDPELTNILRDLATNPSDSHQRGITNQEVGDLVERTQKRAADRVAGRPASPDAKTILSRRPESEKP